MPATYQILGQAMYPFQFTPSIAAFAEPLYPVDPADGIDLYCVPKDHTAVSSTLVICNQSVEDIYWSVAARKGGLPLDDKHYLFRDIPLPGGTSDVLTIGMGLSQNDVVTVSSSGDGVSFTLFGSEVRLT